MYNKKAKVSACFTIITAALLTGFMIMLPFLQYKAADGNGLAVGIALIIVVAYGYPLIYASSIPFAIVALIFGILMFKQQSRKKLISYNVRMLITSCVLLPFLAVGLIIGSGMVFHSTFELFPIIYFVATVLSYIGGIVTQIVTIVILKKSPEEDTATLQNS